MALYKAAQLHKDALEAGEDRDDDSVLSGSGVEDASDDAPGVEDTGSDSSDGGDEGEEEAAPEDAAPPPIPDLPQPKEIIAGRFSCSLCPKKAFVTTEDLTQHLAGKRHKNAERRAAGLLKPDEPKARKLTPEQFAKRRARNKAKRARYKERKAKEAAAAAGAGSEPAPKSNKRRRKGKSESA